MRRLGHIYSSQLAFERIQVRIAWIISYLWFFLLLVLQVLVSSLFAVFLSWEFFKAGRLLAFLVTPLLLVLYNLPLLHVFLRLRRFYRAATDVSKLEELPPSISDLVWQRTHRLIARMSPQYQHKLNSSNIRLLFERRNFKATPSMIAISRNVNLIFPLGFFKVMKADPDAADAMIAHELAHYLHQDSGLLLEVKCYLKAGVVTFYYHAIMFALVVAYALTTIFYVSYHERAPIEKKLEEIEKSIVKLQTQRRPSIGDELGARELAKQEAKLKSQLRTIDGQQLTRALKSASYLLVFVFYGLLLLYLRRRVHRSEELADLFASLITHPGAVASFLSEQMGIDNYNIRSLHPQITRRIKLAKEYEAIL